jgi:hypothetical protein
VDLEPVWQFFINRLILNKHIEKAYWIKITGIPFLYIKLKREISQGILEKEILNCSALAMKGKRLHSETIFVRKDELLFVYRHRFHVPQEKMFCCGNLCADCTRLK